ncbi:MAG TPA: NAD(P)H-hydrate dehydratase [Candidatus Limnocylindria bacterium]|nr:NAD(P)H-hydrate dehydratase [Candidatus Limnocylindria bacterium]
MDLVLTPAQMRALEDKAFALGVPSLLLMESAARAAHGAMIQALGGVAGKEVLYLCGPGNNGGDGLAMARMCAWDGGTPRVLLTEEPRTPDAQANLAYARAMGIPVTLWDGSQADAQTLGKPDAAVDAVYGTGFHGALPERLVALADVVNGWDAPVFAVDAPSGLDSLTGRVEGGVFLATRTIALGHLKTGLCLTQRTDAVGDLQCVPIGIPKEAYAALPEGVLTAAGEGDLAGLLPERARHAHKGDAGRVLMYMGSMGMAGAAGMAALAALRAGAGLVTVACPYEVIPVLQALVPNAMCVQVEKAALKPPARDVFALGCGLGQADAIWGNVKDIWREGERAVWDADALNLLARHPVRLGENAVMTPHPGEAARLLGVPLEQVTGDPVAAARSLHEKYGCAVVLKGHVSVIHDGARTALNVVGSPALAKGGSGDALTGILAALMAQEKGKPPFDCAVAACLWLGMAGREAARRHGVLSPLTRDVVDCVPDAVRTSQRASGSECHNGSRHRPG